MVAAGGWNSCFMAPSLATCNLNGGNSQICVIDAPGAGRERVGRDGGVCGHRLGVKVDATICYHRERQRY